MAKRMTDTEKWKKPFFKSLPVEYKCFWLYLLDDCDHCGIWHVDQEVAELRLGIKLSFQKALGLFKERVVVFDNETKWFIPDFIPFQYGALNTKNKMFKPVLPVLEKYKLMGHLSPIYGVKVIEQVIVPLSNNPLSNNTGASEIFLAEVEELRQAYLSPQNSMVFDQVCMNVFIPREKGVLWVNEFCKKIIADGETVKTLHDFKRHFNNWIKRQTDVQNPPTGKPQKPMVF